VPARLAGAREGVAAAGSEHVPRDAAGGVLPPSLAAASASASASAAASAASASAAAAAPSACPLEAEVDLTEAAQPRNARAQVPRL